MSSFAKNLSAPTPISRPSSPINFDGRMGSFKESNENAEEPHNQMGSDLQNLKKSTTKHFMSPTVSASLKTSLPRKKILAERKEAFGSISSNTHLHQTPEIDLYPNGYSNQITPLSSKISDPHHEFADSGSNSYDPLTNYLSPRPKFLRYNPNRRLEILHRRETELTKKGDGLGLDLGKMVEEESLSESSSSWSLSQDGFMNQEEDGSNLSLEQLGLKHFDSDDDDEDDEAIEEEEGHWYSNKVLKSLLLLTVLFLSTSYISTMNDHIANPSSLQTFEGFKERDQKIQNHVFRTPEVYLLVGRGVLNLYEGKNLTLMKVIGREVLNRYLGKNQTLMKVTREKVSKDVEKEGFFQIEMEEQETVLEEMESSVSKTAEISFAQMGIENLSVPEIDVKSNEEEHNKIYEAELFSNGEIVNLSVPEIKMDSDVEEHTEIRKVGLISIDGQVENQGEFAEVSETDLNIGNLTSSEIEVDSVREEDTQVVDPELLSSFDPVRDETIETVNDLLSDEFSSDEIVEREETVGTEEIYDNNTLDVPRIESTENGDQSTTSLNHSEVEVNSKKTSLVVTVGTSVLSILGVLGLVRFMRRKPSAKNFSPSTEPSLESTIVEDGGSDSDSMKKKVIKEQIASMQSYVQPSSSVHSKGNNSMESYRSRAPMVELLGEYEFGGQRRSSLNKTVESSEQSNFSELQENKKRAMLHPSYQSFSEISTTGSHSYGRVSLQEKNMAKEESKEGDEVKKMVATPVRRSSRIRNRSVTSP